MKEFLEILRDLVVRNWWLKICALLLAWALWLMVRGTEAGRGAAVTPEGHAQSFETKMNIHLGIDDMHSNPAAVPVRAALGKRCAARALDASKAARAEVRTRDGSL
jgi:hypothetical protein